MKLIKTAMIKKIFLFLALTLPLVATAQSTGSWKIYSKFSNVDKIIESPTRVYYISGGSLYSYNPDTDENIVYDSSNYLSDVTITDVYYNPYANYLAISYDTGNIDLLYDNNQKVVNMSEIKDAVVNSTRTINDIDFAPGKMIVATAFGIVIFDDKKYEVIESGMYNVNVPTATFFGDNVAMFLNKNVYVLPSGKKINNINNFVATPISNECSKLRGLTEDKGIFVMSSGTTLSPRRIQITDEKKASIENNGLAASSTNPLRNKNGLYFSSSTDGKLYQIDSDNFFSLLTVALDDELKADSYGFYSDITTPWRGNSEGIGKYDFDKNSYTVNPIVPNGLTCAGIGRMTAHPDGGVLATVYGGSNYYLGDWSDWNTHKVQSLVNYVKKGKITDITPDYIESAYVNLSGNKPWNGRDMVFDPDNSDIYYFGLLTDGLLKLDMSGNILLKYDESNSTLRSNKEGGVLIPICAVDIDGKGNLWTIQWKALASAAPYIHVLSAEGRRKAVSSKEDWDSYMSDFRGGKDTYLLAAKKSNLVISTYNNYNSLMVIDSKGQSKIDPNNVLVLSSFIDQDAKSVEMSQVKVRSMFEDHLGRIWFGTENGVYVITDPNKFMTTHQFHHVKVPRNDGTNYADYLLDGEKILAIDEDEAGRIWIGTETSGAYLVSGDLTNMEIIANYTVDNSSLLSDKIYAVKCDKETNEVYFGMREGLVSYMSDASYAADDYSEVIIYPNPVRPDYHGWVTIKGLMDNSLVKITDSSSNLIFQGTSNGGMISWDACRSNGERVPTGVYYVFASQNSSGSSSGDLVGKIMVIK